MNIPGPEDEAKELSATRLIWGALALGPLIVAAVVVVLARSTPPVPASSHTLAVVFGLLGAVFTSLASRLVPPILPDRDDFTIALLHRQRVALGAAAAELGVILCLVLFLATHDALLLAFAVLPYVALLSYFPTERQLAQVRTWREARQRPRERDELRR